MSAHAINLLVWLVWMPLSITLLIIGTAASWRDLRSLRKHPLRDLLDHYRD